MTIILVDSELHTGFLKREKRLNIKREEMPFEGKKKPPFGENSGWGSNNK
jgi:hypothetical protein